MMKQSSLCKGYVKEHGAYKTNFLPTFCWLQVSAYRTMHMTSYEFESRCFGFSFQFSS